MAPQRQAALATRDGDERFAGPHDADDLDRELIDAAGNVDFGAVRVPVPERGSVTVEPSENGRMQAVHISLPEGRLSVSALAAPKSSRLWPDLATEIDASLREGGARVRSFQGEWGRELHATSGAATSVFVGVDGARWMLYGVATGPTRDAPPLLDELRRMVRGTIVVRGRSPYPVRTVLPLETPAHLVSDLSPTGAVPASDTVVVRAVAADRPRADVAEQIAGHGGSQPGSPAANGSPPGAVDPTVAIPVRGRPQVNGAPPADGTRPVNRVRPGSMSAAGAFPPARRSRSSDRVHPDPARPAAGTPVWPGPPLPGSLPGAAAGPAGAGRPSSATEQLCMVSRSGPGPAAGPNGSGPDAHVPAVLRRGRHAAPEPADHRSGETPAGGFAPGAAARPDRSTSQEPEPHPAPWSAAADAATESLPLVRPVARDQPSGRHRRRD